jgi:hypothetical protein
MRLMTSLCALALAIIPATEPPARALTATPLTIAKPFAHITAARELADGTILVSDVQTPLVVGIKAGATTPVGSAGTGPEQYAQPGGFYGGPAGSTLLMDHNGPRTVTISPAGKITGAASAAVAGVRSSSDSDTDQTRLDSRGVTYFVDRAAAFQQMAQGATSATADLVRLDPATQARTTIAKLMQPRQERIPGGDGMVMTRSVIGDPADGWGVAANGDVAVVRANPYRVEWFSANGHATSGPTIAHDEIPLTADDRDAMNKRMGPAPSAGVGPTSTSGARNSNAGMTRKFADVKPPFFPDDVAVSPEGKVWVMRTQPFGATGVIYDVFDHTGARIDRVRLPADSRVIGFGPATVLVREGAATLKRYKL